MKYFASGGSCDWTGATPQTHTKAEMDSVVDYAKSKGIKVYNPYSFDGDIELLKEQIDVISDIKEEFRISEKITVKFATMADDDFAETNKNTITFNKKVLRSREVSNKNLQSDNILAANDINGISAHEMGHIISSKYGEKGLDIAKEVYYNKYNKAPSRDVMLDYLVTNVSTYCDSYKGSQKGEDIPPHKRVYNEITPEVLSKNMYGEKTEFSAEFVKLLKGRCFV